MRVEFLGTGGYHPNKRRHTACVMLPELGILFDAGTATFRVSSRLATRDLQVFLSHSHVDHIFGLTFFLTPMLQGDLDRVRVYGTQRTLTAVREHLFAEATFPLEPDFEYVLLEEEIPVPGEGLLTHMPLVHPGGATGYRIDWPERSLAYITDTSITDTNADGACTKFVRDVDLLIHECYLPDEMAEWSRKTGHSHVTPVAELARAANVGRLMLVHIDPRRAQDDPIGLATARSIFPATEIAEDLTAVEI